MAIGKWGGFGPAGESGPDPQPRRRTQVEDAIPASCARASRSQSEFSQPSLGTGQEKDKETATASDATGEMHYRARAYSPRQMRFVQMDPPVHRRAANHYAYAAGLPNRLVDPDGRNEEARAYLEGQLGLGKLKGADADAASAFIRADGDAENAKSDRIRDKSALEAAAAWTKLVAAGAVKGKAEGWKSPIAAEVREAIATLLKKYQKYQFYSLLGVDELVRRLESALDKAIVVLAPPDFPGAGGTTNGRKVKLTSPPADAPLDATHELVHVLQTINRERPEPYVMIAAHEEPQAYGLLPMITGLSFIAKFEDQALALKGEPTKDAVGNLAATWLAIAGQSRAPFVFYATNPQDLRGLGRSHEALRTSSSVRSWRARMIESVSRPRAVSE